MGLLNKTEINKKLCIVAQEGGRQDGKTKERTEKEVYQAEYQHGSGAAGEVDEVLPTAGQGYFLGDPQSPGRVSEQRKRCVTIHNATHRN